MRYYSRSVGVGFRHQTSPPSPPQHTSEASLEGGSCQPIYKYLVGIRDGIFICLSYIEDDNRNYAIVTSENLVKFERKPSY